MISTELKLTTAIEVVGSIVNTVLLAILQVDILIPATDTVANKAPVTYLHREGKGVQVYRDVITAIGTGLDV